MSKTFLSGTLETGNNYSYKTIGGGETDSGLSKLFQEKRKKIGPVSAMSSPSQFSRLRCHKGETTSEFSATIVRVLRNVCWLLSALSGGFFINWYTCSPKSQENPCWSQLVLGPSHSRARSLQGSICFHIIEFHLYHRRGRVIVAN